MERQPNKEKKIIFVDLSRCHITSKNQDQTNKLTNSDPPFKNTAPLQRQNYSSRFYFGNGSIPHIS
jgi:hypothetical protein